MKTALLDSGLQDQAADFEDQFLALFEEDHESGEHFSEALKRLTLRYVRVEVI